MSPSVWSSNPSSLWLHPNWNLLTVLVAASASVSEPYVPVVLEPSPYLTMYWHCDLEQPLPSPPSCAHGAELQENGT
jgi:hypothetical protein